MQFIMPIITAIEIEEQGCVGQGGLDGYLEDQNGETWSEYLIGPKIE
jgi:hypothetical protein